MLVSVGTHIPWHHARQVPSEHVAALDRTGVDAEVLVQGGYPPGLPPPGAARLQLIRDFNSGLADYCGFAAERLVAIGELPLWDVAAAREEAERVAGLGLRGVLIPLVPGRDGPWSPPAAPYSAPSWSSVWEVLERRQLALIAHCDSQPVQAGAVSTANAVEMMTRASLPAELLASLITTGVFQNHPGLNLVCLRSGAAWLQQTTQWLERMVDEHPAVFPALNESPSMIFQRHVYATLDWNLGGDSELLGPASANLMWSTDSWFQAGWPPQAGDAANRGAALLRNQGRENALWGNAARVFRLSRPLR